MDIEAYWQENRRFVLGVGAGLLAFLIGRAYIARTVGADLRKANGQIVSSEGALARLAREGYSGDTIEAIERDNDALREALTRLRPLVDFRPRPDFTAEDDRVTPAVFLGVAARLREELRPAAGRANVDLDETLGLPDQSPTREDELARHLLALDQIEHLVSIAIDERTDEIKRLRIRLDPGLRGRGTGQIERTRVDARLVGNNLSLLEVLRRLQAEPRMKGEQALVESFELSSLRENPDDGQLDLVLVVASVLGAEPSDSQPRP